MREDSGRNPESHNVGGDVVRLNDIVRIVIVGVPPTAELNVQLTPILLRAFTIPADKCQNSRRFEVRDVAYLETVRSVPEAAREP